MDPVDVVRTAGGAMRAAKLARAGATRAAVARAVRAGALLTDGAGLINLPDCDPAVRVAVAMRGGLDCVSALVHRRIPVLREPEPPHVRGPSSRSDPDVVWHRGARPRTPTTVAEAPAALATMLRCRPPVECFVAADAILRLTGVAPQALSAAAPARARTPARWILAHADARAGSPLESVLRFHLLRNSLHAFDLQVPVSGLGHVDFLIGGWLIVETDGHDSHSSPEAFAEDLRRTAVAAEQGYFLLRLGWRAVYERPDNAIGTIRRALRHGGRRALLAAGRS